MKYRVVTFNSNKHNCYTYKETKIIDSIEEVLNTLLNENNFEVFKCNDKGNNYSHREITDDIISYISELKGGNNG